MTSERKLTAAENALVEQFSKLSTRLPGGDGMHAARRKAIEILAEEGLPSRKIESWHYTDLRTLLKEIPAENEKNLKPIEPFIEKSSVFASNNGKTAAIKAPDNFSICSLKNKLEDISFVPSLNKDDAIGLINTAFLTDGWGINIPAGANITQPIELQTLQNGGQSHIASKIIIGAGASCTIIERLIGDHEESLLSAISDVDIGEGAKLTWFILREQGNKTINFNRFNAILKSNSNLNLYLVNAGASLTRQEVHIAIQGREADFRLRGINLLSGVSHLDTTMLVRHLDEASSSTEIIRNVVTDKARGAFQGLIGVAKAAQKTDARMACNSLILSDDAEFDAKPELEIFADDVACGHGATVAEIDREHLFYLMARGIPEVEARGLLIKAFVSELVDEIDDETIRTALTGLIDTWLEGNL